jgi:hypothetical protein
MSEIPRKEWARQGGLVNHPAADFKERRQESDEDHGHGEAARMR